MGPKAKDPLWLGTQKRRLLGNKSTGTLEKACNSRSGLVSSEDGSGEDGVMKWAPSAGGVCGSRRSLGP